MAIWQFDFYAVPNQNKSIADLDEVLLWQKNPLCISGKLERLLPQQKSWSEQMEQYGKEDETCIQIFHIDERMEVFIRIDMRSITRQFIALFIDFLKDNDALILYDHKIYEASNENILKLIIASDAFKFCTNPYGFIDAIG